jgi:WD40 repeat protein
MRFLSVFLVLAILFCFVSSEQSQAQQPDAEKEKRIGEIKKEIADLRAKLTTLKAELAKLQPAQARSVDIKPEQVLKGHAGGIGYLRFAADNASLFSFSYNDAAIFWDVATGKESSRVKIDGKKDLNLTCAVCSSDFKTHACGYDHEVGRLLGDTTWFRDLEIQVQRNDKRSTIKVSHVSVPPQIPSIACLALAPDGNTLACCAKIGDKEWRFALYDLDTNKELTPIETKATSLLYSPDGNYLVTHHYEENDIVVRKTSTMKVYKSYKGTTVLAIDKDSKTLAIGDGKKIKLLGLADDKEQFTLEHPEGAYCLAFSGDGKYLATGGRDNTFCIWEAATGKKLATVDAHVAAVTRVAFSPDGKTLATGSGDKTIKLWSMAKVLGK